MSNRVLSISRVVEPEDRVEFNQWCRELNVSANYVGDIQNNDGLRRGREIMASIRMGRMGMDEDGVWKSIKGMLSRI